ncbi:MAG: hypothetical protein V4465_03165 [Patescibacteria group bacterium]
MARARLPEEELTKAIEEIKRQLEGLTTLDRLAPQVGISRQSLANVRDGTRRLQVNTKIAILVWYRTAKLRGHSIIINPIDARRSIAEELIKEPFTSKHLEARLTALRKELRTRALQMHAARKRSRKE